ncbi:uncharacterized protein FTJAE_13751 [Fusarium tjaetaba]|uniref:Uncharacterized protein n=1 Tax=Fusarium tjaetaba TaxID=1567544 RepID=A0A8H5QH89_9HYPO|nr:uncharacterized protein FTJAE_13751 [Fusarium tjaetaba]KAF5614482.1 hypothetical protein FTJAE_13751 [Fusarium tjaetaba]
MEATAPQSTSQLSTEDDPVNEMDRKRHTPMPSFVKAMLVTSIEKHMAEYTVEFIDNDQRLHVVLPPGDYHRLDTHCVARRDLEKAMQKTKLSTFFEAEKPLHFKNLEMLANITKRHVEDHAAVEAARREGVHTSKNAEQNMRMERGD